MSTSLMEWMREIKRALNGVYDIFILQATKLTWKTLIHKWVRLALDINIITTLLCNEIDDVLVERSILYFNWVERKMSDIKLYPQPHRKYEWTRKFRFDIQQRIKQYTQIEKFKWNAVIIATQSVCLTPCKLIKKKHTQQWGNLRRTEMM